MSKRSKRSTLRFLILMIWFVIGVAVFILFMTKKEVDKASDLPAAKEQFQAAYMHRVFSSGFWYSKATKTCYEYFVVQNTGSGTMVGVGSNEIDRSYCVQKEDKPLITDQE